ncbi:protein phosphatase 1 regulatory subunit 7 isoform X2 [Scyliorhinus torazame]|uniref:protein phosphatase 1 regulatory subunit 7 isoform X2 n=1 Tax=Scyliorhinus torazame TaxID=75743 RepID=UPI003B591FD1
MAENGGDQQLHQQQAMEIDRRVESEESGDEEGRKKGTIDELSQNIRLRGTGGNPSGEPDTPVDIDAIILDPEAEDVDLNHCRIGKIEGFDVLKKVKVLCLRQNLIKTIENLEHLLTLRELDLYDNQINQLEHLQTLKDLEILDLSFNIVRKIEALESLTKLKKLFLVNNKIAKIENVGHLDQLEMLELGSNRIRSNRLTKIEGMQSLVNLQELYLSHNGIEVIEGLENNKKLTTLDIATNKIKKIENISHLTELQEFWMNDNLIEHWSDLDELKNAKDLQTVYLEGNPLQKDPHYRRKVILSLPSVRQIDATFIRF